VRKHRAPAGAGPRRIARRFLRTFRDVHGVPVPLLTTTEEPLASDLGVDVVVAEPHDDEAISHLVFRATVRPSSRHGVISISSIR